MRHTCGFCGHVDLSQQTRTTSELLLVNNFMQFLEQVEVTMTGVPFVLSDLPDEKLGTINTMADIELHVILMC